LADTTHTDAPSAWIDGAYCGFVTVGERGQVVIPAALRRDCEISPGDRLLALRAPIGKGVLLAKMDVVRELFEHLGMPAGSLRPSPEDEPREGGGEQ
jgi:AbrB family looped-hinge helix DNA binding protein